MTCVIMNLADLEGLFKPKGTPIPIGGSEDCHDRVLQQTYVELISIKIT